MFERYLKQTEFSSYEDFMQNYKVIAPDNFNFGFDVMDELAETKPDAPALVWCDENGAEATFTYAQIKEHSNRTANYLKSLGIGKGDIVMLILKRRYEYWFNLLALHKIGAVAIPATHLLSKKDIEYRCNAADIKMIIAYNEGTILSSVDAAHPASPSLTLKVAVGGNAPAGWSDYDAEYGKFSVVMPRPQGSDRTDNEDTMLLYFTSGTTGMPKMVKHTYDYPLSHILTAKYWQKVTEGGLHLTVADTGWAKAAWGKIYGQWICGSAVFVYDYNKFVPTDLLRVISKHGVTTFCAPPTIYRFIIKEDFKKYDLSKLTTCAIAGEPLNPEIYNKFFELTGLKLTEIYGQTETTVLVGTFPWVEPRPGSMGKPTPQYHVDLVDDDDKPCEAGEEGQIVVRSPHGNEPGFFRGYYRDETLTRRVYHNGIYHTGDIAWKDEDGYYWFVGRTDDIIKSSGYRIGPFEVESALIEHPAVMECAITAVPDEIRGQIVKATVVLAKGYVGSDALVKELQNHVKKVTAPYKYPRIIEFVTELPKTISGKIRRVEIRDEDKKLMGEDND